MCLCFTALHSLCFTASYITHPSILLFLIFICCSLDFRPKSGSKGSDVAPGCVVHPISSLTPYQNRYNSCNDTKIQLIQKYCFKHVILNFLQKSELFVYYWTSLSSSSLDITNINRPNWPYKLFVCLFDCLFVWLFDCLCVCLFVCLLFEDAECKAKGWHWLN